MRIATIKAGGVLRFHGNTKPSRIVRALDVLDGSIDGSNKVVNRVVTLKFAPDIHGAKRYIRAILRADSDKVKIGR